MNKNKLIDLYVDMGLKQSQTIYFLQSENDELKRHIKALKKIMDNKGEKK